MTAVGEPRLLAVSDLHVRHAENADIAAGLHPGHPGDWLIVAGDVARLWIAGPGEGGAVRFAEAMLDIR